MARVRGNQRDGFTPSGTGKSTDQEFAGQDVPAFTAKYRIPPYLRSKVRKQTREGDE
jgi:hypothetical protein